VKDGDQWHAFVKRAIDGEPDDPFVAMLRRTLAAGSRVIRVNLAEKPKGPAYRILMSRVQELSVMEIPHSASFTRWSVANGVRMASPEEETRRFVVLLEERFAPIVEEYGKEQAQGLLLARLRTLNPARTAQALADLRDYPTAPGRAQIRAAQQLDAFLAVPAGELGGALHYPEMETESILDEALERFTRRRFHGSYYPKTERLGLVTGPDRRDYSLYFYGENEGAAVVTGPSPIDPGEMALVPEVHRTYARDEHDAAPPATLAPPRRQHPGEPAVATAILGGRLRRRVVRLLVLGRAPAAAVVVDGEKRVQDTLAARIPQVGISQISYALPAAERALRRMEPDRLTEDHLDDDAVDLGVIGTVLGRDRDGEHQEGSLRKPFTSISPGSARFSSSWIMRSGNSVSALTSVPRALRRKRRIDSGSSRNWCSNAGEWVATTIWHCRS
jgi:hypothetical protein